MALEAVVFSQGLLGCCTMAGGGGWSHVFGGMEGVLDLDGSNWDAAACSSMLLQGFEELENSAVPLPAMEAGGGTEHICGGDGGGQEVAAVTGRRKRRRTRSVKNKEEVENQRITHIAVERNRRKQMNEYLAVLRSLMPAAYVQRGDQASIIGGAINFVKELEQLLQSLEAQKGTNQCPGGDAAAAAPFANFFTFPQYSTSATRHLNAATASMNDDNDGGNNADCEASGSKRSAVADIEVTMVESHANLKVLSRRRPKQLLRMVAGLQDHRLTVLHLNMTSAGHMVLYSFSLKVEDDCQLSSVDDIATAVHQIVEKIEEEHGRSLY